MARSDRPDRSIGWSLRLIKVAVRSSPLYGSEAVRGTTVPPGPDDVSLAFMPVGDGDRRPLRVSIVAALAAAFTAVALMTAIAFGVTVLGAADATQRRATGEGE